MISHVLVKKADYVTQSRLKVGKNQNMLIKMLYNKHFFNLQKTPLEKMLSKTKSESTDKNHKSLRRIKDDTSESQEFQLQYHQIKKFGFPVNKKKLRIGNWEFQQNLVYFKFLEQNKFYFISEQERRKNKVFYRLSKILKKRTPDQCRSHHQKLQMKYGNNIDEIIKSIKDRMLKKCPHRRQEQEQKKKMDFSNQNTALSETISERFDKFVIIKEDSYYKISQNDENKLSIEINNDQIQEWSLKAVSDDI